MTRALTRLLPLAPLVLLALIGGVLTSAQSNRGVFTQGTPNA